ncbi:MAG: ATP-binding protein [Patescibacteria group bacterium]
MQEKEELQAKITELDRTIKMLVRRDFELSGIKEKREVELKELDHIAKLLIRRDLELTQTREKRENEFQKLEERTKELEESKEALLNILEDVEEEKKRTEDEKNKTEAIIKNFADGLLLLEEEKITIFNPKAEEIFGLKEEEVKEKIIWALEGNEKIAPLVALFKAEKSRLFRKELSLREDLIVEVSTTAVLREGEELGNIVIFHDITREKFVERMKTEFVAIAAHQLRTPLSAVKWILRMFLDGDMGQISETQSQFLQKTYESNERMINLVNDLLNVARIEEGRFLQKMQECDMADILLETVGTFKEEAEKKGLSFSCVLPSKKLPKVSVDKEKIIMAIQNIIENAIFYTKSGGISLSVDYLPQKNEFMVKVQDTGIGIPENQKVRIFSRFFRGGTALKTETEGSGLGLFIAKNIVEAHGGKIWFDSQEGKGTTFYFTLPANGIASKNLK